MESKKSWSDLFVGLVSVAVICAVSLLLLPLMRLPMEDAQTQSEFAETAFRWASLGLASVLGLVSLRFVGRSTRSKHQRLRMRLCAGYVLATSWLLTIVSLLLAETGGAMHPSADSHLLSIALYATTASVAWSLVSPGGLFSRILGAAIGTVVVLFVAMLAVDSGAMHLVLARLSLAAPPKDALVGGFFSWAPYFTLFGPLIWNILSSQVRASGRTQHRVSA